MRAVLFCVSHRKVPWVTAMMVVLAGLSTTRAAYRNLVGYDDLQTYLGAPNVPNGSTIQVMQVEAKATGTSAYMPNYTISQLLGRNQTDVPGTNVGTSDHATRVAVNLDGTGVSIADGIGTNASYPIFNSEANYFLNNYLKTSGLPATTTARVINQSWVGSAGANDGFFLRRLDYTVAHDDVIQVVGLQNSGYTDQPLWKDSFNAITVGITSGGHLSTTLAVDSVYTAGRVAPTLVAPGNSYDGGGGSPATSYAAPMVSAAATLLLDAASHNAAWSQNHTYNNRTRNITDGESSEVIKAVLMAGADRYVINASGASLTTYTVDTANGLDHRFGAGQLNIYNSYRILEGTEQHSQQDGNNADITKFGWDYDNHFGGSALVAGSNATGSYFFTADGAGSIIADLVWNLDVNNSLATSLHDLNLALFDLTADTVNPVLASNSTTENTENIWYTGLLAGHDYELRVMTNDLPFDWDYGLAWQINTTPVPEPASIALLAVGGLALASRRRKQPSAA